MYEGVIQNLIDELGRLPGVGPKGAQRIAFYLLAADRADVKRLADALIEVTERVRFCRTCGNVAEAEECRICLDQRVRESFDVSLVRGQEMKGDALSALRPDPRQAAEFVNEVLDDPFVHSRSPKGYSESG